MFIISGASRYVTGLIVGVLIGLWLGVNIGKDKPLLSNPLEEPELVEQVKKQASEALRDTRRAVRERLKD